jgi:hypothetical protein
MFGPGVAEAQTLANPVINNFEIAPAGSLEWEMLDRSSVTGQYQTGDLSRLARLTVLESIAMYENLRADLRGTAMGARLEGEMTAVWDAAELFYLSASSPPVDTASLMRTRALLADVGAAYRQVDATLGQLPGISPSAAFHLQDIGRLLPVMNSAFDAIETDLLSRATPPVDRSPDLTALRERTGLLAGDLRGLIQKVSDSKPVPAGRDDLIHELNGLLELVQGFDQMMAAETSTRDFVESLRLMRSRMWRVEAWTVRLAGIPELSRRWQQVRQRINAISDEFGLPRVIARVPTARSAKSVDRILLAQIDRALAALDKFLTDGAPSLAETAEGLQFQSEAGQLRRKILRFRQHVAANEPTGQLATLLRDIETANRQLSDRAGGADRVDRGVTRLDTRSYRDPAQAINRLRALLPKPS